MKHMKTLMTLAFALFLSLGAVHAQQDAKIEKAAKAKTEKMVKALNLNEEQETLVYRQYMEIEMNQSRLSKMEASAEEKEQMVKAYQTRLETSMKTILTEDQLAKYETLKQEGKMKK